MEALPSANPEIQKAFFDAAMDIWLSSADFSAEEDVANRRRKEDGIMSVEALLEWFAENEAFCESVRAKAKARLEDLKKKPASNPDVGEIGTVSAEVPEQDMHPLPEEASSAQDSADERKSESP